jgi:hypothetical protein
LLQKRKMTKSTLARCTLLAILLGNCGEQTMNTDSDKIIDTSSSAVSDVDQTFAGRIYETTEPIFMRTIFLDDHLLKTCICENAKGFRSEELKDIFECKVYIIQRTNVLSFDSSSVRTEGVDSTLVAAYIKNQVEWKKVTYRFDQSLIEETLIIRDEMTNLETDTIYEENPSTGYLDVHVARYYHMKRKIKNGS